MSFYKTCPYCGANLDPGESCDCKENTPVCAANTDEGKVEMALTGPDFRLHDTTKQGGLQDANERE